MSRGCESIQLVSEQVFVSDLFVKSPQNVRLSDDIESPEIRVISGDIILSDKRTFCGLFTIKLAIYSCSDTSGISLFVGIISSLSEQFFAF